MAIYFILLMIICVFVLSHVVLIPEEAEDMWHAYNIVAVGDTVKSTTIRYLTKNMVYNRCMTQLTHWQKRNSLI